MGLEHPIWRQTSKPRTHDLTARLDSRLASRSKREAKRVGALGNFASRLFISLPRSNERGIWVRGKELLDNALLRTRPFDVVPLPTAYDYDLTIISSLLNPSSQQVLWYWGYLRQSFGKLNHKIQIIVTDNSPDNNLRGILDALSKKERPSNIDLICLHEPKRGQTQGLNCCLEKAAGKLVMKIDLDKTPAKNTLAQLFLRLLNNPIIDLLSARALPDLRGENLAQRSLRFHSRQWWNAGEAYVVKREYLHGWNQVLIEDEYTHRTVVAQGGHFQVADDLPVFRPRPTTLSQQAKSAARHLAGGIQLDTLILKDKFGQEWNLADYRGHAPPEETPGTHRLIQHFYSLSRRQWSEFPAIVVLKAIRQKLAIPYYLNWYLKQLEENPDLCVW